MRRMILRMIATGSLSAFSTAVLPELPSQALRGPGGAGAVQQARAGQAAQPQPTPVAPPAVNEPGKTAAPTNRALPRGSLLDLSV